jgi:hypothetical protein
MLRGAIGALFLLVSVPAGAKLHPLPAPEGNPMTVARGAIKRAGHPCPTVSGARRMSDGSIAATCSNHELYLIFQEKGAPGAVALRCSAAKRLLNISCPKP